MEAIYFFLIDKERYSSLKYSSSDTRFIFSTSLSFFFWSRSLRYKLIIGSSTVLVSLFCGITLLILGLIWAVGLSGDSLVFVGPSPPELSPTSPLPLATLGIFLTSYDVGFISISEEGLTLKTSFEKTFGFLCLLILIPPSYSESSWISSRLSPSGILLVIYGRFGGFLFCTELFLYLFELDSRSLSLS